MPSALPIIKRFKDPVSGLTHLAGALLGAVGLVYLLVKTIPTGDSAKIVSASIFGSSLILLFLSSAAYHLLMVSKEATKVLRRIDHSLIFTLIAGTYTPFCLIALPGSFGSNLLITIWSIAVVGLFFSIFWVDAPRWITTGLYLFMGWFVNVAFTPLKQNLSSEAFFWLAAGGLCYTFGAFIYGFKRPNPFPPHFGFHEIWHLFVLAGGASHFISVAYVLN